MAPIEVLRVVSWAVFFDRDGVLTGTADADGARSPHRLDELVLAPGAGDAVAAVRAAGALVFVITNQPDIARGSLSATDLQAMNDCLAAALHPDAIRVCPHDSVDGCRCRKPQPGMLVDLADEFGVDLRRSVTIGDRWVDVAAGSAAGTATVLVDRPYSWQATSSGPPPPDLAPDHRVADVAWAARIAVEIGGC